MNIYDALNHLERSIKNSPENQKYQELRKKIEADPTKLQIVADLRKKQMELQTLMMMGQEIPEEKQKELEQFSTLVQFHPTIQEFLQAEYMLSKIFEDVTKAMSGAFDFWIPEGFPGLEQPEKEEYHG